MTLSMVMDLLRGGLFSLAHFCGGSLGLAIVVASLGLRALMLPLSVRAARRAAAGTARKGIPDVGSIAQFPLGIGLYATIRSIGERSGGFLWIKSLARPDRSFAIIGALIAGGLSWLAASSQAINAGGAPAGSTARGVALGFSALLTVGLTIAVLSHMSAGVALYSITSSVAGYGERRLIARLVAAPQRAKR